MSDSVELNNTTSIAKLFHTCHKASDTIRDTGFGPRIIVYRIIWSLTLGKGRRSDRIQTKMFIGCLKQCICCKPITVDGKASEKAECDQINHSNPVRNDLGMKSLCRRRRSILTGKF